MKNSGSKTLVVLLLLALLTGTVLPQTAAAVDAVISLRIEGLSENLYHNSALMTNLTGTFTLREVLNFLSGNPDVPQITVINEKENSRITQIGALKEKSIGSPYDDGWMISVNGKNAGKAPDMTAIGSGDDVVIFYGDPSSMQYPEIDLTRMITDGIVRLTSSDPAVDEKGSTYIKTTPVAGAAVTWDGMAYTTNESGEIIIDSTGAGVRHTIQVERYNAAGLPTVLRFAPGYSVKYGFSDVDQDEWYYGSVMYVASKYLLTGVSETDFGPDTPMNRAMFVTVIGRLTNTAVDQTAKTGFPDVINDGWSTGYIAWAAQSGIVMGYPDGTFGQYTTINREQIAVLLYRYAAYRGFNTALANSDLSAYTDVGSVSDYAENAVRWAVENGILLGSGERLDPLGLATRAQAAALLERFLTKYSG